MTALLHNCKLNVREGDARGIATLRICCWQVNSALFDSVVQTMCSYLSTSSAWPVLLGHRDLITLATDMVLSVCRNGWAPHQQPLPACRPWWSPHVSPLNALAGRPVITPQNTLPAWAQIFACCSKLLNPQPSTCATLLLRMRRAACAPDSLDPKWEACKYFFIYHI